MVVIRTLPNTIKDYKLISSNILYTLHLMTLLSLINIFAASYASVAVSYSWNFTTFLKQILRTYRINGRFKNEPLSTESNRVQRVNNKNNLHIINLQRDG